MLSLNIGPLALSTPHALLLLSAIVAWLLGSLVGRRDKVSVGSALADIFLAAMLSARIGFVLLYFEHYRSNLWGVLDIRDGGFSAWAALAGGLACAGYHLWRYPKRRGPLGAGLLAGAMVWGVSSVWVAQMSTPANALMDEQVTLLDGSATTLRELAGGRPLVLNLWATWCPPCVREMPVLEAAQAQHQDVAFVFANQAEDAMTVTAFLTARSLSLEYVALDPTARLGPMVGSQGLPTTLFFDAQGHQVDAHFGGLSHASLAQRMRHFR